MPFLAKPPSLLCAPVTLRQNGSGSWSCWDVNQGRANEWLAFHVAQDLTCTAFPCHKCGNSQGTLQDSLPLFHVQHWNSFLVKKRMKINLVFPLPRSHLYSTFSPYGVNQGSAFDLSSQYTHMFSIQECTTVRIIYSASHRLVKNKCIPNTIFCI